MDEVNGLDCQLRETILKLVKLNDNQVSKLEDCQQFTEYKEECDKVGFWLQLEFFFLKVMASATK